MMRFRFICPCCKRNLFFMDKTISEDICFDCYSYLMNIRKIPKYIIDFYYKYGLKGNNNGKD